MWIHVTFGIIGYIMCVGLISWSMDTYNNLGMIVGLVGVALCSAQLDEGWKD